MKPTASKWNRLRIVSAAIFLPAARLCESSINAKELLTMNRRRQKRFRKQAKTRHDIHTLKGARTGVRAGAREVTDTSLLSNNR
jgi:hypothetical protein